MNITQVLAHQSNYSKGRKQAIEYIVVHYTANNGDTAQGNGEYFGQPNRNASAHYFVDENEAVQTVLDNDTAWHCGTTKGYKHPKCRNDNSIGVEMCSEKDQKGQYYINEQTQCKVVELVKFLMAKYNIPVENVIRHYDVTGKMCPEPFVRNQVQWLDFKKRLTEQKEEEEEMIYNYIDENMPDWAKPTVQKLIDKGILVGNEKGELLLTGTMLRIFSIFDRDGYFNKYNTIEEVPDWAKPTIQKFIDRGALKGNEKGELMLTYNMLRMFVINDNMGCYGK